MAEYKKPGMMVNFMNGAVRLANKAGLSPQGSQTLSVRGRKTGKPMSAPVNPLEIDGQRYLVAPRGDTQWARNLRVAGEAELRLGRKTVAVKAEEVPEGARPPIIAAYLKRWGSVTRDHFGASSNEPADEELARIAARTPVFRIQ